MLKKKYWAIFKANFIDVFHCFRRYKIQGTTQDPLKNN